MPAELALREAARSAEPFPEYLARYMKASPSFMDGIRRGVTAFKEGRISPWEDVERELGLG